MGVFVNGRYYANNEDVPKNWWKDNMLVTSPKVSDGGSSTYYDLPEGARDIDDLIEHKDMNYRVANIFKACYRYGEKAGTSQLYDLKKIIFFAQREIERLEKLK